MAVSMDALLSIKANVSGEGGVAKLANGLKNMDGTANQAGKALKGLGGAVSGLSGVLGALAPFLSIAGIAALGNSAIEAGDHMYDLAQKTGVSVESLAKFGKAAKLGGTDLDSVGNAMVKLSKGLAEAARTGSGPAASALQQLGISAIDSSGKLLSADKVMLQVADRFKQMPDGAEKTALALQLFGKAGADMIPVLNEGGQAIDGLSSKMTTAFAEKAAAYDDNLKVLQGTVSSLGIVIAEAILPALTNMAAYMTVGAKSAVTAFTNMKQPIADVVSGIGNVIRLISPWVGGIVAVIGVMKLAKAAVDAWRTSQTLLLALSGPKGWAALALGIGAAVYLTNKMNEATKGVQSGLAGVSADAAKVKAEMDKTLGSFQLAKDDATQAKDAQAQWTAYVAQTADKYAVLQSTVAAARQQVDGALRLADAQVNAETAINNAAKSVLQTKLNGAKTDVDRLNLTQQIADIDINNAKLQLIAADAQYASEVAQARLKLQSAKLEMAKADAELAGARARGVATEEYQRALAAQERVVDLAYEEWQVTVEVANAKGMAADATYEMAVQQAKANVATLEQQQKTDRLAALSRQAAESMKQMPSALADSAAQSDKLAKSLDSAATSAKKIGGGFAVDTRNSSETRGMTAWQAYAYNLGQAAKGKRGPAQATSTASSVLTATRGSSITATSSASTATPQVNITTGPVMQSSDGKQWVTVEDLQKAQQQTVASVMQQLRTPAGRYAMGVS